MSKKRKHAHPYVGMPAFLKLELFSQQVQYAFDGVVPYLCGSSVKGKKWRDVDVRLILDDKPFRKRFDLGEPDDRIHKAPPSEDRANFRSATPMGFARAVFEANQTRQDAISVPLKGDS